jgi:fumarylacetoacetase
MPMPRVGPSAKLDIEVELGALVGTPTEMGRPIGTSEAYDSIFGYVLLNDWSARDIQVWEYQPLGSRSCPRPSPRRSARGW